MRATTRFKPWMRWTAFAVVLVGGAVIAWHIVDAKAQRELEEAKAAFARHGFPTRLEEIIPPPVPEEENADALLREAWRIATGSISWGGSAVGTVFRKIDEIETLVVPTMGGLSAISPEAVATLEPLMADPEVARFFDQLHLATQRRTWHQNLDYAQGPAMLLPHVSAVRLMVRLLAKRAAVLARDPANARAAWDDLIAAWTLADWTDRDPALISFLTGNVCRSLIQPYTKYVLESVDMPPQLDAIIALHRRTVEALPGKFARALHLERLALLGWMERHYLSGGDWMHALEQWGGLPRSVRWCDPWLTPILSPLARPRLRMELRACYEQHLLIALALQETGPAMVAKLQALDHSLSTSTLIIVPHLFPQWAPIGSRSLTDVTEQRALLVLFEALRWRRDHGAWPASAAELNLPAELMIDACSDQPLVVRAEGNVVMVYGFGFDGDDDGGRPAAKPHDVTLDGDVVVKVQLGADKAEKPRANFHPTHL